MCCWGLAMFGAFHLALAWRWHGVGLFYRLLCFQFYITWWSWYLSMKSSELCSPDFVLQRFSSLLTSWSVSFPWRLLDLNLSWWPQVDKIFSGYQPCQVVKNYWCLWDHLCSHHRGLMWHTPTSGLRSEIRVSQWHASGWSHKFVAGIYCTPCECSKVYVGLTGRTTETMC
jgi:hypothetical protein